MSGILLDNAQTTVCFVLLTVLIISSRDQTDRNETLKCHIVQCIVAAWA